MQTGSLSARGSFRYGSVDAIHRALLEAHEHLHDEDDAEHVWLRAFSRRGTTLIVDAQLPVSADRHVTAAVLATLAEAALEGQVDVTLGGRLVDAFSPEYDAA